MKIDGMSSSPEPVKLESQPVPAKVPQPTKAPQVKQGSETNMNGEVITPEMLERSVVQANKALASFDKTIERTVHEKTHTVMYVIRDTRTNEVIKEFPPKKIQDMIAKMWELAGLFVDEKA